jgi:HlyD family secretion protein
MPEPSPQTTPPDLSALRIERDPRPRRTVGRRRPRWVRVAIVLVLAAVLGFFFREPLRRLIDRWTLPEVRTARVTLRSAASAAAVSGTSSNGYIVAKTRAALSADTPGRIVEMNVEEGSVVKQGDVVARLYSDEYKAALRRAEADLLLADAAHARTVAEVAVAQNALERLRSAELVAQADIGQYEAALSLARLNHERAVHLLENNVDTAERRDRAKSELDAAQSRAEWAKASLEAARVASGQGTAQIEVVKASLAEAAQRQEVARAARALAQATLDKTEVRAPFDGIVVLKDAEVGEVVSPNVVGGTSARGSVVTMVDFASLEVQAEVSETSLSAVAVGAPARVFLDAYPEKPYPGPVDRIWPTANRTKATVEVRIAFEARDDRLRPEMGVRVVFLDPAAEAALPADGAAAQPVVTIPPDAAVERDGASVVFVLDGDRVRARSVTLGEPGSGRVPVREGLVGGETIVLGPPATLLDGDRVIVAAGR